MKTPKFCFSKRFFVAVLLFFGQIIYVLLQSNINIAIVEMTNRKAIISNNQTIIQDPEFDWDSKTKGLILGATSYGGLLSVLGGYLAFRYGGSTLISIGCLLSSITTIFNPIAIHYSLPLFWFIRVLVGVGAMFQFVGILELWSHWSPMQDRSKLIAIGFSGIYTGSTLTHPLCGFIIHKFGWPIVFYVTGVMGLIWTLIWFIIVPNKPSSDKWISREELTHIRENQTQGKPNNNVTIWKNMIKSRAILALCSAKFVYNAGYTTVVTCLPMYIKDITNAEIDKIGIMASIPNITSIFLIPLLGYAVDTFQSSGLLTATQVHKLFLCIGFIGGSVLLFATACFASSFVISITCLTIFKVMLSLSCIVTHSIAVFLAPQCAGVVSGFSALFHHLSAIVTPMIFGFIVTTHSASEWSICFFTIGIISLIGGVLFLIFGSSEPQSWSVDNSETNDTK